MKKQCLAWILILVMAAAACPALAQDGAGALAGAAAVKKVQRPSPQKARMPGPFQVTEEERQSIKENGNLHRNRMLNFALSMLEEGNPFLGRYNLITNLSVKSRFRYGVPYFWGGQSDKIMFCRYPQYAVMAAWQNSPSYYKAGTNYLYGYDCVGYVKWVLRQAKLTEPKTSKEMFRDKKHQVFNSTGKKIISWTKAAARLQPGDVLVRKTTGLHMAMFIGTLRQFGYTAEEVPDLAPYLDYPLVIHCTTNAAVADRFDDLIRRGPSKYRCAAGTDGGVCVSLVGLARNLPPYKVHQQNQDTWYFVLPDQTWLTLMPFANVKEYCWYRP